VLVAEVLGEHEGCHVLEHRHLDRLPLPAPLAVIKRDQDALRSNDPDHMVGKHHGHEARLAQRPLVAGSDSRHALYDGVVGGATMIGAVGAKAFEVAHDEPWMPLAQHGRRQPKARECRRADIGNEHVGRLQQAIERAARLLLLEVERERTLVAVEMGEFSGKLPALRGSADGAQQIPRRRLDLDDVRAIVGEEKRCGRTNDDRGEVDDADAGERPAAHGRRSMSAFT